MLYLLPAFSSAFLDSAVPRFIPLHFFVSVILRYNVMCDMKRVPRAQESCVKREVELGSRRWVDCHAPELFSTGGSLDILFRTAVERSKFRFTQTASHRRGSHHFNIYCSGGG